MIRGDVRIATGVEIGPFAYVRPGTVLGEGAKIGTFVEVKKPRPSAPRTKIPHLSYIGDAEIGEDTNIAAGNVTANFKHEPGQPKAQDPDREQRQDRCRQYRSMLLSTLATTLGLQPGTVITDDVPPGIARRFPATAGNQGRVGLREAWKA